MTFQIIKVYIWKNRLTPVLNGKKKTFNVIFKVSIPFGVNSLMSISLLVAIFLSVLPQAVCFSATWGRIRLNYGSYFLWAEVDFHRSISD